MTGALAGWPEVRKWGGVLNGVALMVFLANTASSLFSNRSSRIRRKSLPGQRGSFRPG
jgi:hypothetical protein